LRLRAWQPIHQAEEFKKLGAEVRELDFEKKEHVNAGFVGIDSVFLLTPFTEHTVHYTELAVAGAKHAGVKFILRLSASLADAKAGHAVSSNQGKADDLVAASGIPFAVLRPTYFFTNMLGEAGSIKASGSVYGCSGPDAKWSSIHPDDIADAAVVILTHPSKHHSQRYDLTGNDVLTNTEYYGLVSKAIGKEIKYVDVGPEAYKQTLLGHKVPEWTADGVIYLESVKKNGYAHAVSPNLKNITGKEPRTVASFVEAHKAAFTASS